MEECKHEKQVIVKKWTQSFHTFITEICKDCDVTRLRMVLHIKFGGLTACSEETGKWTDGAKI